MVIAATILGVVLVGCGMVIVRKDEERMTEVAIPPIDAAAPERIETATFALG